MVDLVVKVQDLEDSQAALKKIMTEFNNASDHTKQYADIWSNGHVADAMSSFASNWKDHRAKLLKKMDDAYKHTAKCIEGWSEGDGALANSVQTHQSGGAGHSRAE